MADNQQYAAVRQSVRTHDRDRYLAALFAPVGAREAMMALYAFNADVARIPETVSEPMLGEIRLQWWRDALDTLEKGGVTGNPVADGLGNAIRDYDLPKALLLGAVDARVFDVSGEPMPDMQALKAYLQKTQGALYTLAARIVVGKKPDRKLDTMARLAGFAWGLTDLLRMLPVHLARGRFYLPVSHFRDYGADEDLLFSGETDDKSRKALLGLGDEAREAFGHVSAGINDIGREAAVAFLPCALVPLYLATLQKQAASPLQGVADINPLRRISCLAWAVLRRRLE